jgi:hypothetical protein
MTVNLKGLTDRQIRVMSGIPANGDKISVNRLFDIVQYVGWDHEWRDLILVLAFLRDRELIKWADGMVCRTDPAP